MLLKGKESKIMDKNTVKANFEILVAKIASGLNTNAIKYLVPLWISGVVLVNIRVILAAIVFWIISFFFPQPKISLKDKIILVLLGAFLIYGYLAFIVIGIGKTTPISSSIFMSLQPVWVFIIGLVAFKSRMSLFKVIGLLMGLGGALICIFTQQSADVASDRLVGNLFCLLSSIIYAFYLVIEKTFVQKGITTINILKYTFLGASLVGVIISLFTGIDAHMFHSMEAVPWGLFMFILIFATIINYILTPIALKYLKSTVVSVYGYVSLIVVTITSFILGQDHFSWTLIIAIILIVSSVYFVEIAESKKTVNK